jgi:hypothetical protein
MPLSSSPPRLQIRATGGVLPIRDNRTPQAEQFSLYRDEYDANMS